MKTLYFILFSLLFAGCSYAPRYAFFEAGTQSNDSQSYNIESDIQSLQFKIAFDGVKKKDEDRNTLSFKMNFTNTCLEPVVLKPSGYSLIDDENNRFRPAHTDSIGTITLYPEDFKTISLAFDLPRGYDLDKLGSLRLIWSYKVGNETYRRSTKFIKKEVRYYYRDRYHNYYYPYYYYDGYPYYYGYYPWRFHFGFYGTYRH
jgi:hypothetical protein